MAFADDRTTSSMSPATKLIKAHQPNDLWRF
jgi:hypothetical protein